MSLFDQVRPRPEVLDGELTEAMFAASLEEVASGSAPPAYGSAETFFATTHPSAGLRTLLDEALGRLSGKHPDAPSVIRLETSLGGGKTHNLIALYHAARGGLPPERAAEFMDPTLLPDAPVPQLGILVGSGAGARTFPSVDGYPSASPWGYLALQLGGPSGYGHVRIDDEAGSAPGSAALKLLIGDQPTLILIDEIARYLRVARAVRIGDTTLAGQMNAYLMALMETVDSLPRAVLVLTTSGQTGAFGEETAEVLGALAEAGSLMARKEVVLRPSEEADLPRILARRLFAEVRTGAAAAVAEAYSAASDAGAAGGLDLPEAMTGGGWANLVASHYPFHPSLVSVLDKRLSTIPNFQRTRGALRLLARAVRQLWVDQPEGTELIHLHHLDLGVRQIAEELSSRLDRPTYEPVIRADIASQHGGELSHAERVDERMGSTYARRLATTIYLYSLTRDVPGVSAAEVFGAVLTPGDDPNVLQRALDGLESSCWYLHADVRGLRFSTEASLVKLVQEAEAEVSVTGARTRATKILSEQFRDGIFKVRRAWEDARIPDNADDAWLIVMHWDDFGDARGVDARGELPRRIADLFERTATGGVREFRNRLVILAPSIGTHEAMVRSVRTHLALEALSENAEIQASLTPDKRAELQARRQESRLLARVAVCNHVNVLYVPTASGLDVVELDVVTQASVQPNQADAILGRLAAMEKTLAAGDPVLDPAYVKAKLGAFFESPQPTSELVRAFARRTDLKIVLDRAQLVALVVAGVRSGAWEYQDPERGGDGWATREQPTATIRLAEDTFLHPPGTYHVPKEAPAICPFCGKSHPGKPCPETAPAPGARFVASGAAGVAFSTARAAAADAGRSSLRELVVSVEQYGAGTGSELARLHSVVPPSTLGVHLTYDLDVTVQLSEPNESAHVEYHGNPSDFAVLREAIRQLLSTREATLTARVSAVFGPPLDLSGDEVQRLAQAAIDTGPTRCSLTMLTEDD
jgi:hypothetical protein